MHYMFTIFCKILTNNINIKEKKPQQLLHASAAISRFLSSRISRLRSRKRILLLRISDRIRRGGRGRRTSERARGTSKRGRRARGTSKRGTRAASKRRGAPRTSERTRTGAGSA